jgi:hypothetical protein
VTNELSAQVESAGLRAYEQALAFEALKQRRMPLLYAALTGLIALCGVPLWSLDHAAMALGLELLAILFALGAAVHWRRLRVQHTTNLRLLAQLEAQYGEELPWLRVERHLAALEKLRAELERDDSR